MEDILSFDFFILDSIQQSMRCDFLDSVAAAIGFLTTSGIIWILLGVVLLFFRKTRAAGIILLSALLVGFLTGDVLLKHLVDRPRPFTVNTNIVLAIKPPTTASFPSTHSTLAAAATAVLLAKARPIGFVALAATVIIAFSRLYLYVHYPTDVLCGLLLGTLIGLLVLWLAKKVKLENKLSGKS